MFFLDVTNIHFYDEKVLDAYQININLKSLGTHCQFE